MAGENPGVADMTNTCSTCAYKSDAVNTRSPNYCYCFDKEVGNDDPGCEEWRGSLRTEPLLGPDEQLVIAVGERDTEVEG